MHAHFGNGCMAKSNIWSPYVAIKSKVPQHVFLPDHNTFLLGVQLRFRHEVVVRRNVRESHQDHLHFFWYNDNNSANIFNYHIKVYVFGNSLSPSIVIQQVTENYLLLKRQRVKVDSIALVLTTNSLLESE